MIDIKDKKFDAAKAALDTAKEIFSNARLKTDLCLITIVGEGGIGVIVKGRFNERGELEKPAREPEQQKLLQDVKDLLLQQPASSPVRAIALDLRFDTFRNFLRVPKAGQ